MGSMKRLLMAPAAASLFLGTWVGLARLGWLPSPGPVAHGPLLMLGFLGTLIAFERAVALRRWWAAVPPALSGGGAIVLCVVGWSAAQPLFALAALGLALVQAYLYRLVPGAAQGLQGLGALCQLVGTLLASPWWWANFLILTVAGERLELSGSRAPRWLGAACAALLTPPSPVWALGLVALAIGLPQRDVARRTWLLPGLPGYCGRAILTAYVWLGAAGVLVLAARGPLVYDAVIHSLLLGFVITMVMAHAPLLVKPVLGVAGWEFRPWLYGPLLFHQCALVGRVGSDLAGWPAGRACAGLANALALISFAAVMGLLRRSR